MNQLDSARVGAALQRAGHQLVTTEREAECVLVNTCTVTAEAERKSRQIARSAGRRVPRLAVMGCGPKVAPLQWHEAVPGGSVFTDDNVLLSSFNVKPEEPVPLAPTRRARQHVAVQMGCDNRCTFCITRSARGAHQSLPADAIVEQVRALEAQGVNEVVLTGINLAAWGAENSNREREARLHTLLETLLHKTTIPRIRLSSLGPQYLHPPFFDLLAEPRICAYLHLSVQSGSPSVLQRMGRGHGREEVVRAVEAARRVRPEVALAADIIAGFPGETEAEHAETRALIQRLRFAKLHLFPYSPRAGTVASDLTEQISPAEKKRRTADLRALGNRLRHAFIAGQMGTRQIVLVEGRENGLTGHYLRVRTPGAPKGALVEMVLTSENLMEPEAPATFRPEEYERPC